MIAKRVVLKNWCQHQDVDISMSPGVVGVMGRNGSGKTNFIKAISDALTGDFHKEKALCLSRGAKKGSISVTFSVPPDGTVDGSAGFDFTVTRNLHDREASLVFSDGREKVTSAAKVNAAIKQIIPADLMLFREVVFVNQTDISTLLFKDSTAKDRIVQRFFGMNKCNEIESMLANSLSLVTPMNITMDLPNASYTSNPLAAVSVPDVDVSLLESQIAESRINVKEYNAQKDSFRSIDHIMVALEALDKRKEYSNKVKNILARKDEYSTRLRNKKQELQEALRNRQEWQESVKRLWSLARPDLYNNVSIAELQKMFSAIDYIEKAQIELNEINSQIEELKVQIANPEEVYELISKQQGEITSLSLRRDMITKEVHKWGEIYNKIASISHDPSCQGGSCPSCGQAVTEKEKDFILQNINQKNAEAESLAKELSTQQTFLLDIQKKFKTWNDALNKLNAARKTKKDGIDSSYHTINLMRNTKTCEEVYQKYLAGDVAWKSATEIGINNFKQYEEDFNNAEFNCKDMERMINRINAELADDEQDIAAFEKENANILTQHTEAPDLDFNFSAATSALIAEREKVYDINSAISRENVTINNAEKAIEVYRNAQLHNLNTIQIREFVSKIKSGFGPNGIPKIVVSARLAKMQDTINSYLAMFEAPFTTTLTDGLDFKCHFPNMPQDNPITGAELSEGQKNMLAISFRFAALEGLTSNIGLLVLDEPSAPIDAQSVQSFGLLLESVRALAHKTGMQIIMPTHEEDLVEHFDQTVRF